MAEVAPQQAQSRDTSQWVQSSTRFFQNVLLDEPDNHAYTSSENSDDAVDSVDVMVGPSEHAANAYDLNQLGVFNVETYSWEPIRSTKSGLYLTNIIRLTQHDLSDLGLYCI